MRLLSRRGRSTVSVLVEVTDSNAPFLAECLAGLAAQERLPDEVLVVASGSGTDTNEAVHAAVAAVLPFPVRDSGEPTGTYLMVVQAGDVLTGSALGALADSLDSSGSQVAVPGPQPVTRASVTTAPSAAVTVRLASMMVRADHWRDHGLARTHDPAAHWLTPVRAVVEASALDVVPVTVLAGPPRGTGVPFGALPGLTAHLPRLVPEIEAVLARFGGEELTSARHHLTQWLVAEELTRLVEEVERCDAATWAALVHLVDGLLDDLPAERFAAVPVEPRVRAWLTARDRRADLESFNLARWQQDGDYPTEVHDGGVRAVLPVSDVPPGLLALSPGETPLVSQLRRARWLDDGRLELEVAAFTRRVGAAAGATQVTLTLASGTGRRLELGVEPLGSPEVNLLAEERHHEHGDGLYRVLVEPELLVADGAGRWRLEVTWAREGVRREGPVRDVEPRGSAAALPPRPLGGLTVTLDPATAELGCGDLAPAPTREQSEITALSLDGDTLVVGGTLTGALGDGPVRLRLRGPRGSCAVRLPAAEGPFHVRLPLRHDPWGLGATTLPPGGYRLRLQEGRSPGGAGLVLGGESVARTPYVLHSADLRIRVGRHPDGSAQVVLGPPLTDDEAGVRAQHELRRAYTDSAARLDPNLVYLQSYGGGTATDSPLAIHHELRRARPDLRLVWGVADASVVVPQDAERVLLRSRAFYSTLATCGHIVSNTDLDGWFRKRPGQRVLHTTHGYPGKAMGVLEWEAKNLTPSLIERNLRRTSGTWDLLLMPHPDIDRHYREQYRYDGPILSAGYPRDDELVGPDVERRRQDTRRRLGIGDRTAVLHAPTWRDELRTSPRAAALSSTFDAARAADALGEDYVILLRGHRFHRQRPEARGRLLDVTDYPEVNDLVMAADAAVLDYSSLRFDLALTGQPMIFLVPDLDRYESGRGFLYDFRSSAPGPLLDTTDEVIEALRDLDAVSESYAEDYTRFNAQFNAYQDGHAAARTVAAFFGPPPR